MLAIVDSRNWLTILRSSKTRLLGLLGGVSLLAGCVSESASNRRHEFTYSWWVTGEVFTVGVALALSGAVATLNCWKNGSLKGRGRWIVMFLFGLMLALGLAPTTFLYRVAVDQTGFSIRSGVWGTSVYDMKFANLARMRLIAKVRGGRRSSTNYFLECEGKSGSVHQIPLHDGVWAVVGKEALPLIKENAGKHEVAFVNETTLRIPARSR